MTNNKNGRSKTKISWVGKIGWFFVICQVLLILSIIYRFKSLNDQDFAMLKAELDTIKMNLDVGLFPTFRIIKLLAYFLGLNALCPFACFLGWLEYYKSKTGNVIVITSIICALITIVLSLILAYHYDTSLMPYL
ncbi:MAG: hypothetical protein OEV87_10820 [Phycisphaerae bacterium]|nr:hypothetical protein [Phycisphaerae bacterium]